MNLRQLFLNNVAQTSDAPLAIEPTHAEGVYIFTQNKGKLIDLISGISVSSLGHSHPKIVQAVKQQAEKYMHLMVYGEFVEQPQVKLAQLLTSVLDKSLNSVYFTNSGAEATEGALKLAKRYTGRSEIMYFKHSYHGSTMGALSVLGDEYFKSNYRPLIPNCTMLEYGNFDDIERISEQTAAVIIEPVQAESGITVPPKGYLKALEKKCKAKGALLIVDEIQTGLGRTGALFRHQTEEIVPDILLLAKAFGGGMPLGAFVSNRNKMEVFQDNPFLGHITTFGGHPVSCAAALASLEILLEENIIARVEEKGQLFEQLLKHPKIEKIQRAGLMMSLKFNSFETNKKIIDRCIKNGLLTDWFLFNSQSMRIAPPLIITKEQIEKACSLILESIDEVV
ncbi:MAG: aspartate aminotransferase family protein [Chitinophagales bacterium]|nr:aspartate aminotransferase family protein [Chitinophagales bacterium]